MIVEYGLSSVDSDVMANRRWPAFPSCRRPQSSTARFVVQVPHQVLLISLYHFATIVALGALSVFALPAMDQGSTLKNLAQAWDVSFKDWDQSSDPCLGNWSGVTCDSGTNSRVVIINLSSKSLQGPIPPEISHLTYLQELYLDNNNIEDPIPPEIGQLKYLEKLSINSNELTSSPPEALLNCNLTSMSLHENRISGELPVWIGQMSTLKILDMHSNDFWGGLPPEYGKLKNLENLQLWGNELSGFIPDEWRDLTNVHSFGMDHLFLTGAVPDWLFELPKLRNVTINSNQFVGQFPNLTRLMHNEIANLTTLDLSCNFFQGDYPVQYYNTPPVPITTIKYYSNCFSNETDGSATATSAANATQNTPQNCSRVWDCTSFYKQMSITLGKCAPCPSSQEIINVIKCICGKASSHKTSFSIPAIVGIVIGGAVAIILALILTFIYAKKKTALKYPDFGRKLEGIEDLWNAPQGVKRFTLRELEKTTKKFNEKYFIGLGSYGKVYHGILKDGNHVAIKCASVQTAQSHAQFRNEINLLDRLHHRNLVPLNGFCDEGGLQILVYEYMENGDLHDNLFGEGGKIPLNAYQRLKVAIDIAQGLDYLHSFADPPVIHRDIKASNILLDHSMVAKLADFGISRISANLETHVSTAPIGTTGYLDPDYFRTNQLSIGSDIYAFGIVLLEIITGQPVIDFTRLEAVNLHDWVKPKFKKGGIRQIIDPKLGDAFDEKMYKTMTEVALMCSSFEKFERPLMKEVLNILEPYSKTLGTKIQPQPRCSPTHLDDKSLADEWIDLNRSDVGSHRKFNTASSSNTSSNITTYFNDITRLVPR